MLTAYWRWLAPGPSRSPENLEAHGTQHPMLRFNCKTFPAHVEDSEFAPPHVALTSLEVGARAAGLVRDTARASVRVYHREMRGAGVVHTLTLRAMGVGCGPRVKR
jgi:hypothetical protein